MQPVSFFACLRNVVFNRQIILSNEMYLYILQTNLLFFLNYICQSWGINDFVEIKFHGCHHIGVCTNADIVLVLIELTYPKKECQTLNKENWFRNEALLCIYFILLI